MSDLDRLVASLDPATLMGERWFGGKGRPVSDVSLVDGLVVDGAALAIVDVSFTDGGGAERYTVLGGEGLWAPLFARLAHADESGLRGGSFALDSRASFDPDAAERPVGADQSNTSVLLGDGLLVKCYRRLWPGEHPEVELVTYLGERLECVPRALGSLRYRDTFGGEYTLAFLQTFVADARDGWSWGQELHESLAAGEQVEGLGGPLGEVTARLHAVLAEMPGARSATDGDRRAIAARAGRELAQALAATSGEASDRLREWAPRIRAELEVLDVAALARLSRVHGDLHVGQVLQSPSGLDVIDFEGEPTRPPEERREIDLPLRDVASMLRSFEHLPRWVFRHRPERLPEALAWTATQRHEFLEVYGSGVSLDRAVLRALEVEKATYEFVYAATFLPEWMPIAVGAMDALLRP